MLVGLKHAIAMAFSGLILFGALWIISSITVFMILTLMYAATLNLALELKRSLDRGGKEDGREGCGDAADPTN